MEYVKCKACGYIMEAGKLGDACPACGVPAKQFEPYVEKISEGRLRLMKLDIHPVVVHLPQAFAVSLTMLPVALFALGSGPLYRMLYDTTLVLAAVLPFSVVAAFAAGLFDGKLRFRKLKALLLRRKMAAGTLFFILSAAAACIAFAVGLQSTGVLAVFFVCEAASLGMGALLGIWGATLTHAAFPG